MWLLNNIVSSIWIDGQSMTSKKIAKYKNQMEFMNVYASLVNEALGRYKFKGLPDTVNQRVLTESLLWYGCVGFFTKDGKVLALPGLPTASYTLYGDPTEMIVHGRNGYVDTIKLFIPNGDDSALVRESTNGTAPKDGTGVWVRENKLAFPFVNYCIEYADKIADTLRTLDTTRLNIKRPSVVVCEESVINSVKAYFNKRDNNEEFIVGSGVFPVDKVKFENPFETNPENLRDCTMLIEWYYNQFRQLEGMKAPSTVDKKAQVSVPELNRDENISDNKQETVTDYLQEQLDFVNEKLGCNITVERNMDTEDEEVEDDVYRAEDNVQ
ncbi:MAG: hypothetical protein IKU33_05385 [Bacteroidales bacterium]|nr:hypothetical protein [Bacteroidales bacterium]